MDNVISYGLVAAETENGRFSSASPRDSRSRIQPGALASTCACALRVGVLGVCKYAPQRFHITLRSALAFLPSTFQRPSVLELCCERGCFCGELRRDVMRGPRGFAHRILRHFTKMAYFPTGFGGEVVMCGIKSFSEDFN